MPCAIFELVSAFRKLQLINLSARESIRSILNSVWVVEGVSRPSERALFHACAYVGNELASPVIFTCTECDGEIVRFKNNNYSSPQRL